MLNSQQIIARCGTGVNLGEVFERNDLPRDASFVSLMLAAFAKKGFKSVRIPVTWYPDDGTKCMLDDATFMGQVDNAVYYSVSLGMCVVLDLHFEHWLLDHYDGTETYNGKFYQLWQRIVNRYKGIAQENLIYEILNEPVNLFGDWSIGNCNNLQCIQFTKTINEKGYWAIRNIEPNRTIMLPSNAAQCYSQAGALYKVKTDLPGGGNDKNLIIAVHDYEMAAFCLEWGSNDFYNKQQNPFGSQQNDITKYMTYMKNWQNQMGGPSVIGVAITEFGIGDSGTSNRRNCDLCRTWYRQVAKGARDNGFLAMIWNDCGWFKVCERPDSNGNVVWVDGLVDCALGIA